MIDSEFFNKKFDLIVSLGEDCACSSYLRRFNLQDYTYPFDWLTGASFSTRVDLICNNFKNFLLKENIKRLEYPYNTRKNSDEEDYEDVYLKFHFYHDFNKNQTFDSNFLEIKEKYNRRIERLYEIAEKSQKILFVWWGRSYKLKAIDLLDYYEKLQKKFSNSDVHLLVIEYSDEETEQNLKNNHICIKKYDNLSFMPNSKWTQTMGNEINNNKIFKQIKIRKSFTTALKYLIYKILKIFIEAIPFKEIRLDLKSKLRYSFFRAKL